MLFQQFPQAFLITVGGWQEEFHHDVRDLGEPLVEFAAFLHLGLQVLETIAKGVVSVFQLRDPVRVSFDTYVYVFGEQSHVGLSHFSPR